MQRAYPYALSEYFKTIKKFKPRKMAMNYFSVEHIFSTLSDGYSTESREDHFLIYSANLGNRVTLNEILNLAYTGKAAAFGEPDTASRGFAFALEDYMSSICRARVLMIKDGGNDSPDAIDQDNGWKQLEEWRDRPTELKHATLRPPANFAVNLESIVNQVEDGTWPKCRFENNKPEGQFCALLFPPERVNAKRMWPIYRKAKDLLKAYSPDTFMEEDDCCWNSLYRGGDDWCPPIQVAEGGFFYHKVKQAGQNEGLLPQKKTAPSVVHDPHELGTGEKIGQETGKEALVKQAQARVAAAMQDVPSESQEGSMGPDSLDESGETTETRSAEFNKMSSAGKPVGPPAFPSKPPRRAPKDIISGRGNSNQFATGREYAPGTDPVNKRLAELGYTGKKKSTLYGLVRNGSVSLESIQPNQERNDLRYQHPNATSPATNPNQWHGPQGRHPRDGAFGQRTFGQSSRENDGSGFSDYPAPRSVPVRFASYPAVRRLNQLIDQGEYGRVQRALESPREDWAMIDMSVKETIHEIKRYVKHKPEGSLQAVLDILARRCRSERSYLKMLAILYGLIKFDVEANLYQTRIKKDPLDISGDEEEY
jgi:hypothetical protein